MKDTNWKIKDILILFIIPIQLTLGKFIAGNLTIENLILKSLIPFIMNLTAFTIIFILYKDFLINQWKDFKENISVKLVFSFVCAISLYFVLSFSRKFIGISQSAEIMDSITGGIPYGIYLLASAAPIFSALIEEIIFRHVLFYKFKYNKFLFTIMFFVSAFLFGAIHYNNFNGNLLLTVPYMIIALIYNLIYYFTNNIWFTISIHFIFNFIQSFLAALVLPILVKFML